jgi:hypothetical protein
MLVRLATFLGENGVYGCPDVFESLEVGALYKEIAP